MAGFFSSDEDMREKQRLALLQEQGKAAGGPSVQERLAANKPPKNNPFSLDKFGANNPELQLIKNADDKSDVQRQSFFKGLGAAGQSLLQNSNKSVGEALGAGMGAFTTGADAAAQKGLVVAKQKQKEQALDDFEDSNQSQWTRGKKEAWKLSRALEDPTYFKSYSDKDEPFSKIDVNKATPKSSQDFNKKFRENGIKDYSLLKFPSTVKRATSDNISAMKAFDAQVAQLLDIKFQRDDAGNIVFEKLVEETDAARKDRIQKQELMRMMSENAWNRWYIGDSTEGSAVADAARNYEERVTKNDAQGNPLRDANGNVIFDKKWRLPKDRWPDQRTDPVGVDKPLIK